VWQEFKGPNWSVAILPKFFYPEIHPRSQAVYPPHELVFCKMHQSSQLVLMFQSKENYLKYEKNLKQFGWWLIQAKQNWFIWVDKTFSMEGVNFKQRKLTNKALLKFLKQSLKKLLLFNCSARAELWMGKCTPCFEM